VTRRHDTDAGGPRELLVRKAELRERVWRALERSGAARFPGAAGRIPNFAGAEAAAERLRGTDAWRRARTIKANPDSPQLPVRQRALEDGKVVYMAVPRLAGEKPFLRLDPAALRLPPRRAASIGGAGRAGRLVAVEEIEPVDLVVCGSVAVDATGARLGKGGGYSDLEYALACEAGLIGPRSEIASTVHELQVVAPGQIPITAHDFRLDLVVTPERVIECRAPRGAAGPRAGRLVWEELTAEKIAAIPLLARLARERSPASKRRRGPGAPRGG
jgi:5-formyltetrahydrofolate cyclo-ligase